MMDWEELIEEHAADAEQEATEREGNEGSSQDEARNDDTQNQGRTETVKPAKKKQKGTKLTLDHQKLCGERGIPILPHHFENVHFKGKGHEKEDLARLMFHLEHWGHRLFPRLTFDDILERAEWLGAKKPVKNALTKLRLGMPILSEDFVSGEAEGNKCEEVPCTQTNQPPEAAQDPWEQFMQDYENGDVEIRGENPMPQTTSSPPASDNGPLLFQTLDS